MASPAGTFARARQQMIERQLRRRGISSAAVLEAFGAVPREEFIDAKLAHVAYGDHPLPIAAGQTISQPYVVALMIEAAEIGPEDRVLEVGSGSGYAAAVVSRMAAHVIGIERHKILAERSRALLNRLGFNNVEIIEADGTLRLVPCTVYDAILVAASGSHVPRGLVDELAPGGRLIIPLGEAGGAQRLVKLTKDRRGSLQQSDLGQVRFVPLIGEEGWSDARY